MALDKKTKSDAIPRLLAIGYRFGGQQRPSTIALPPQISIRRSATLNPSPFPAA
jgi:hypothetical protein